MKYLPPPPPSAGGKLTVTARRVSAALVSGTLSGCVICGSSGCHYWPHEGRFHPLHQGCVHRLFEYWQTQLSDDEEEAGTPTAAPAPARRGGAYARRAAKAAASVAAPIVSSPSGLAPVIPDAVLRNPFWRPGEGPDAPWMVIVETNIGRRAIPAGGADDAREWCARLAVSDYGSSGELLFAGAVLAPDGTLSGAWGGGDGIASPPLYSTLEPCGRWEKCPKCERWRWPGCWLEGEARTCADCTVDEVPRTWPVEPPPPGGRMEPPVKVKAKR